LTTIILSKDKVYDTAGKNFNVNLSDWVQIKLLSVVVKIVATKHK